MTNDQITRALEDCETAMSARNCPMTSWEQDFVESVSEQFKESGGLSSKQQDILEGIWERL